MYIAPVIDGHNDLAWTARETADYSVENLEKDSIFQTDIDKLGRGGVGAQFWSVYTPCDRTEAEAVQYTLEQIDFVYRLIERYPDTFEFARTGDNACVASGARGQVASLLGAEGGHSIGSSLGVLRMMARLGLQYMTLTHRDNTRWADSATDTQSARQGWRPTSAARSCAK